MTYTDYQKYREQIGTLPRASAGGLAPTGSDIEGPFYKAGAPILMDDGQLCESPTLHLSGLVMDTAGNPCSEAVLDFWQANAAGEYDLTGFKFRGKVFAAVDDRGAFYRLQTIRPGDYKISDPGQPDDFRCAHIHVKLTCPGCKPLTTQLYFADDSYDATDHWFSAARVIKFPASRNPLTQGRFDFVLERE